MGKKNKKIKEEEVTPEELQRRKEKAERELIAEWFSKKKEFEQVKLEEGELRVKVIDAIVPVGQTSRSFNIGDDRFTAMKTEQLTISKEDVIELKEILGKKVFKKLFGVQYSLRAGQLSELSIEERKEVDARVSSKDYFSISQK